MDDYLHRSLTLQPGMASDLMSVVTNVGTFAMCAVILLVALRKDRKVLTVMLVGSILNRLVVSVLKSWFDRDRPPVVDHLVHASAAAMPSGHAANAAFVAVALFVFVPRWRWWAVGGAGIVGLSRVLLGVHWPTDVLVGWFVGGVVSGVCVLCASPDFRRFRPRRSPVVIGS